MTGEHDRFIEAEPDSPDSPETPTSNAELIVETKTRTITFHMPGQQAIVLVWIAAIAAIVVAPMPLFTSQHIPIDAVQASILVSIEIIAIVVICIIRKRP